MAATIKYSTITIPRYFNRNSILILSVICLIFGSLVLCDTEPGPGHSLLLQKRYHRLVRQMHCRFSPFNKIENCPHGSYTDDCERDTCYKGVGETCNSRFDINGNQYGICASGLECVCGRCLGCVNAHDCELELEYCNNNNRNAIIYE